jgi:hypothetical protein
MLRNGTVVETLLSKHSRLIEAQYIRDGGVVVGERTYRLTRELFDFEALEPVTVKGKATPLRVWVAKAARSRFGAELQRSSSTPLVDREDELELCHPPDP